MVRNNLRYEYPDYKIKQLTFIMDCLGGFSTNLIENIKELIGTKSEINKVISDMQKVVLLNASEMSNRFKMSILT